MEFSTIQTATAWDEWTPYGVVVDAERGRVELDTTEAPVFVEPKPVIPDPPSGFEAVDVALDECGVLYVLTASGDLYTYDPGAERLERLACSPVGEVGDGERETVARALCVTRDTLYVATSAAGRPGRVHAVSRHLLQTRWVVEAVDDDPFGGSSVDATPLETPRRLLARDDGVLVLDGSGFLARLRSDGRGTVVREELDGPTDLATGPDGAVYVLEHPAEGATVRAYDADYDPVEALDVSVGTGVVGTGDPVSPACLAVVASGALVVGVGPDAVGERILFRYDRARGGFERLPAFRRACRRLVFAGDTTDAPGGHRLYAIGSTGDQVYVLGAVVQNRRTAGGDTPYDGRLVRRFDAGEPGVEWHRVTTDLRLDEPGTGVRLRYHATEEPGYRPDDLESVPNVGPTFARRLRATNVTNSVELAALSVDEIALAVEASTTRAQQLLDGAAERLSAPGYEPVAWTALRVGSPADALFDSAEGRYLWVELTLVGTSEHSPAVEGFQLYFPRSSYLRYLPEVYREDERSAAFLGRFLSVFESEFVGVEGRIDDVTAYLDADGIPERYLSWLGDWLALELDQTWSEAAKRRFLKAAPELFKRRGTRQGLVETLEIFLELDTDERAAAVRTAWERVHERERERLAELVEAGLLTPAERDEELGAHAELASLYDPSPTVVVYEGSDLDCLSSLDDEGERGYARLLCGPSCFVVLVAPTVDADRMRTVERLVETGAPVHAPGRTVALRPRLELGADTFLGVNSTLADPAFVSDRGGLGTDTVLTEREPFGHVDLRSDLGDDTLLS